MRRCIALIAVLLAVAACAQQPHETSAIQWTYTPPPPVGERSISRPLRLSSTAVTIKPAHILWSREFTESLSHESSRQSIALLKDGIAFSTGYRVFVLNDDGSTRWVGTGMGSLIAARDGMLFASSTNGFVRLAPEAGKVVWRRGTCNLHWAQWLIPFSRGLFTACAEQTTGDAYLATYSYPGATIALGTYYSGGLQGAAFVRSGETRAWLFGTSSGGMTVIRFGLASLLNDYMLTIQNDVQLAGQDGSDGYLVNQSTFFGSEDRCEPVRLLRLNANGKTTAFDRYAPDVEVLGSAQQNGACTAHIRHGAVYVAAGGNLYRYQLRQGASKQRPALLLGGLGAIYFNEDMAIATRGPDRDGGVLQIDLSRETARIIDTHAKVYAIWQIGYERRFLVWPDAYGTIVYDLLNHTARSLPISCITYPEDVAQSNTRLYFVCQNSLQQVKHTLYAARI